MKIFLGLLWKLGKGRRKGESKEGKKHKREREIVDGRKDLKDSKVFKGPLCTSIIVSYFQNLTESFCEVASVAPLWEMLLILILFHGCLETIILFSWPSLFSLPSVVGLIRELLQWKVCLWSAHVALWAESVSRLWAGHFHIHHLIKSSQKPYEVFFSHCKYKETASQGSSEIVPRSHDS